MVNIQYEQVLSETKTGLVVTTYRDDNIVAGNSYANEAVRTVTAGTEFFVLDASECNCNQIFKLPISLNPSNGTVILKQYEGTDYVGNLALSLVNRNRLSNKVTDITLKLVSEVGATKGSLLFETLYGTEQTPQSSGGGIGSSANALILDPTKKYLFEVIYSEDCTVGYNLEIVEV